MHVEDLIGIMCWNCGVEFAITKSLANIRREQQKELYCPNGHRFLMATTKNKDD